jgi:hypothetical protein
MQAPQNAAPKDFLNQFIGSQQFDPQLSPEQQVAFDFDVMGNPLRMMERRARDYRFNEPGNVGRNMERAGREMEAMKIMAPGWFPESYTLRP